MSSQNSAESEGSPIDDMIAMVKGYIQNPDTFTPETGKELLVQLEDLKSVVDGEETDTQPQPEPAQSSSGLSGLLGKQKSGGY